MDKHNQRPNGETGGGDLPDRGKMTGVTDTYGGNLEKGYQSEGKPDTKSDRADERFNRADKNKV